MEVILLGTGGPRPDPRRMATTTLIRLGEENILFDAGRGVMLQLGKAGVPLGAINTVSRRATAKMDLNNSNPA
jgi:ribonuclease Z